jgi:addiction module RelE/StbE family toxin
LAATHPELQTQIAQILTQLANDPFESSLETHKLKGKYKNHWACTAGYDLRIVFVFQKGTESREDEIWLVNIGTHDEVYK